MKSKHDDLSIGGQPIARGTRQRLELSVAKLYDYTDVTIPVEVIRGKKDGPVLFLSAAVHGDEINGTEIIKRLLGLKSLSKLRGTLIAVPIVNVFGYNRNVRYLPDRRDLNRSFPGSPHGSLAAQIAHAFMTEIASKCTHGIDFHTGAIHRTNLPQLRANLENKAIKKLAKSFGVPVILDMPAPEGALRKSVEALGIPIIVFEGGEALRFDEKAIKAGLHGALSIMHEIGMLHDKKHKQRHPKHQAFMAHSSHWIRAPHSGSFRMKKHLGHTVEKGEVLGTISDPFGRNPILVKARRKGIIIGMNMIPLVSNGDALFHIATFKDVGAVEEQVELFHETFEPGTDPGIDPGIDPAEGPR